MPIGSSPAGSTTAQVAASGKVIPVADATGVTVDTTTYANSMRGSGFYTTLVAPAGSDQAVLALAFAGDAFPRLVMDFNPQGGINMGDGTFDPWTSGNDSYIQSGGNAAIGTAKLSPSLATGAFYAPRLSQVSPLFTITSGALPTLTISSGVGRQINTDRDAETVTPFTGDGTNNAATCAIAISPDNVTYSTVATISIAAALNLTGVLTDTVNARVPAGWYLKLTAVHGTIDTTTYY